MKKRGTALLLAIVMTFGLAMPVCAETSDDTGSASGVTTISGEIAYTTAYMLTIPSDVSNMDLSQGAETVVGSVSVAKQNDNAEFDPAKRVNVVIEYSGKLENTEDSSKKVTYTLQQSKGEEEATDVATGDQFSFSAAEIESGDVQYNLKAVITETTKSGGIYSGTVNFSAMVEDATVIFQVGCSDDPDIDIVWKTYEVAAGTTWGEFAAEEGKSVYLDEDGTYISCNACDCWIADRYGQNINRNVTVDEIIMAGKYTC